MRSTILLLIALAAQANAQPTWRVDPVPATIVPASSPNGDVQFSAATWATRLPNGSIAILDGADASIRFADESGRVLRSMGRRGNGPGEFTAPVWIGLCGDTLHVWDMAAARASLFTHEGFARQFMPGGTASSLAANCSDRGSFAAFTMPGPGAPSPADARGKLSDGRDYEVRRMVATILVVDANGTERTQVRDVLWGEMIAGRLTPNGGFGALPRPLGGQTQFAFSGERLIVARTDSGRIDIFDERGTRVGGFDASGTRRAPTAVEYSRAIPWAVSLAPPPLREPLSAFAREVPPPTYLPAFTRMLTDSEGLIWLVTSTSGDPVTRMRAHRADGSVVATLEIPTALDVFEVGEDFVLGRSETTDGEHAVLLYRFSRQRR